MEDIKVIMDKPISELTYEECEILDRELKKMITKKEE